jgi:hypothetical protein
LHIHTPASEDYAEPHATYFDILQEAERRELEIIAFTDHNSVHGYEQMRQEIDFLQTLERAQRLTEEEQVRLNEYRRLLAKITVLPGFEFTSHFGSHILGLFAPDRPVSLIEATLLQLGVLPDLLKRGACSVPDTRHVTDAYEIITRAGGMVIAAHANGPNGVITETLRMGTSGQSRIAATQHPALHALEFVNFYTDHEKFTSPGFYNGKTEHYERRMFCIQGSDAHRLRRTSAGAGDAWHRHGIGDRYVELLLPDNSFASLKALFASQDFDRVRVPKRDQKQWEVDTLRSGTSSERQILRDGSAEAVELLWRDVAALANLGGGVLIVGVDNDGASVSGIARPDHVSELLRRDVQEQIAPQPYLTMELMNYEGRDLIRVEVRAPEHPPYIGRDGVIYVRRNGDTTPADRGEVIQLCRRALAEGASSPLDNGQDLELPRSGMEIVGAQKRAGIWLYEVRDLRTTAGVTRDRAQGLWAYAISRYEDLRDGRIDIQSQVKWRGRLGLWRAYRQGNRTKYDLVHRDANGVIDHVFFGVSDWGLSESWMALLGERGGETVENEPRVFREDDPMLTPESDFSDPIVNGNGIEPAATEALWGEHRYRWRGRGGLLRIGRDEDSAPRFDLAMKDKEGMTSQEFPAVPREKLTEAWLNLIRVQRPRTGIEVVNILMDEYGEQRFVFRNLRTGEVSNAPWRLQDIEDGTVRQYAARMALQDLPVDEEKVRWWGNVGYMRPMRSQVDLIYRDEDGVDHIYYAARRDELTGEWRELLEEYGEI